MSVDARVAARAAAAAAARAVGRGRTADDVAALVEKFGRHADGYLHARIAVGDQRFYFHRRYGSWLAPGQVGNKPVLKEPEALLGSVLGGEIKYKLSDLSRPYDQAERREREAATQAAAQRCQPDSVVVSSHTYPQTQERPDGHHSTHRPAEADQATARPGQDPTRGG